MKKVLLSTMAVLALAHGPLQASTCHKKIFESSRPMTRPGGPVTGVKAGQPAINYGGSVGPRHYSGGPISYSNPTGLGGARVYRPLQNNRYRPVRQIAQGPACTLPGLPVAKAAPVIHKTWNTTRQQPGLSAAGQRELARLRQQGATRDRLARTKYRQRASRNKKLARNVGLAAAGALIAWQGYKYIKGRQNKSVKQPQPAGSPQPDLASAHDQAVQAALAQLPPQGMQVRPASGPPANYKWQRDYKEISE